MFHYYLLFLQIRVRVLEDLTNKTDEQAVELTNTLKFIRDTINAPIVDDHSLLIIYDYAYVHAKYVNKNVNMSGFNETEKKLSKKAQADPGVMLWSEWLLTVNRRGSIQRSKKGLV